MVRPIKQSFVGTKEEKKRTWMANKIPNPTIQNKYNCDYSDACFVWQPIEQKVRKRTQRQQRQHFHARTILLPICSWNEIFLHFEWVKQNKTKQNEMNKRTNERMNEQWMDISVCICATCIPKWEFILRLEFAIMHLCFTIFSRLWIRFQMQRCCNAGRSFI